eukprot:6363319-Alexandrium_andersonii.AAC.1
MYGRTSVGSGNKMPTRTAPFKRGFPCQPDVAGARDPLQLWPTPGQQQPLEIVSVQSHCEERDMRETPSLSARTVQAEATVLDCSSRRCRRASGCSRECAPPRRTRPPKPRASTSHRKCSPGGGRRSSWRRGTGTA